MARAQITPLLLTWARERAGLGVPELARKLQVREDQVRAWERGDARPTFRQAENYAHRTYVPLGYLSSGNRPKRNCPFRISGRSAITAGKP